MKSGSPTNMYASCPHLDDSHDTKHDKEMSLEDKAVHELTAKYDSYQGLMQQRRLSSVDGSETASSAGAESTEAAGQVSDHERMQVEIFFRSLKTQVFVCGSLANLYVGSTASEGDWELKHTGIPVLILDSGEARSRDKRRIQILLAERGTCFTLWRDTIDNLTSYRVAGHAFHTMHLSSDHSCLIGFSFDSVSAAAEMWNHVEKLTSSPENISLSVPGRRNRKPRRAPKPQPLPNKSNISQPCCFQHITSVDAGDRSRYFSLQTLVPVFSTQNKEQGTEL
ncbi:hypothetical protein R5R35_004413 [Gryllus longicercus]|uniref:Misexpression suppressor of ras 3 n=2 Tax=Gryllus longicercus TaxID=2509291 RepID=A0AAN9V757_9ORTH|nr:Uncharacterized protein GBIM_20817 [Gryllus bimaculatus]